LNDKRHELSAFETVEYTNNSPDTLRFLYFHLWPNAYSSNKTDLAKQLMSKNGKQRLFDDPALRGNIDSLDFKVNNQFVQWKLMSNQPDICILFLNKPLYPNKSIHISTPFLVKIPKGVTSRLGHIGQSYQISQWFPKPAVYDQNGWHQMPYLDQGEFYSEFGRFDVRITLPDNYVVGATGNLQTRQELDMMDKLAADTTWQKAARLGRVSFPKSSAKTKTLHYTGTNIHDFAWFADKRFHVLKGNVTLPRSGKEVTTWLLFTNQQSALWKNAIPYINNAILDFSEWIGDYPYDSFTAVQSALNAGLGMEYPGVTVIGLTNDGYSLDKVIAHEACHNWFYGALGSNERRFPFMDEGMTDSYEQRYLMKHYPEKKLWENYLKNERQAKLFHIDKIPIDRITELEWLVAARTNTEQPTNLASTDYTELNYNLMPYNKASIAFNYLRAYLGDSVYDFVIHDYYRQWKFKHPQPDDQRQIFETNTGKDLSWFFDELLGTNKRLDYKLVQTQNHRLLIQNLGELVSPVNIVGMKGDSVCFEQWVDGFDGKKWIDVPAGDITSFCIDPFHVMPEQNRRNNYLRTSGILPNLAPFQTQLLVSVENPDKHTLMYMPLLNWNREDGIMVGVALHNGFVIPKLVEYFFMPFFSLKNAKISGYGRISYNITPYNSFIQLAKISLDGTQFGAPNHQDYHKIGTGFELNFRPDKEINLIRQKVYGRYILASDLLQVENGENAILNPYVQLGYNVQKKSLINPYNALVSFEMGKTFQKAAVEINYTQSYIGKNNGLEMRLFAGTMLKNTSNAYYSLAPSGRSGRELYLYEGTFLDRFSPYPSTFWSAQMTLSEGGIVSPINDKLCYSKWLVSLSLCSNLPGKAGQFGIKPFVNLLVNDHGLNSNFNSPFFGEAGIKIGLWNLFEIHFPLLVTGNIQSVTGSIKNRIRLVFNLDISKGKIGL